jgi:hypothetical protein
MQRRYRAWKGRKKVRAYLFVKRRENKNYEYNDFKRDNNTWKEGKL